MINVGIDLGGTTIKAGIVKDGVIIRKKVIPTGAERPHREVVLDMADLVLDVVKEEGLTMEDINSVGIGSPGAVNPETGMIVFSANFADFRNIHLVDIMKEKISCPVYLENDANVAGLGEAAIGAGKGSKNCIVITLGTGLGGGIIIDGKIFSGAFYGGGEMGHQVIVADGLPCNCGRKGCWECYSSATGLIRMGKKHAAEDPASLMNKAHDGDLSLLNAKDVFDALAEGDTAATETIDEYAHYLAIGLANTINVFQPEYLIIGGGPSAQGEKLLGPVRAKMGEEIYGGETATKLVTAELGNDAGIIGAAMLYTIH